MAFLAGPVFLLPYPFLRLLRPQEAQASISFLLLSIPGCSLSPFSPLRPVLGLLGSEATPGAFPGVATPLFLSLQPLVGLHASVVPRWDCPLSESPLSGLQVPPSPGEYGSRAPSPNIWALVLAFFLPQHCHQQSPTVPLLESQGFCNKIAK